MFLIKNLALEYVYQLPKYKKKHKQYFKDKKRKLNISNEYGTKITFGVITQQNKKLTNKHLRSVYKKLKNDIRHDSIYLFKLKCRPFIYPNFLATKKPRDIRMGRGKGLPVDYYGKLASGFRFLNIYYFSTVTYLWILKKFTQSLPFKSYTVRPQIW